jgi:outer membrane protein OmpU
MNKYSKIGLTALAGSLVAGSVSAAELSASGSAAIYFSGGDDNKIQGNGWSMADSVTFSASGDVNDIGVTLSIELDGDAQSAKTNSGATYSSTTGANVLDSHSITFDLGEAGTLIFAGHGGSSAMSAVDDVMPTAYEEPWDVVTGADADIIGGHSGNNMFTYKYSHDSGVNLTLAYINAADAVTDVSYSDIGISYTGVEGLTIGYAEGNVEQTALTESDEHTLYATYAMGAMTVGVQTSEKDVSGGSTSDTESQGFGLSYQVNDDLAVSVGSHEIEYNSGDDQESTGVSASYTMGSLAIKAAMNSVDNIANTATNDRSAYELGLTFNF